jgi:CSLREA domain-containing protein
MNHSIIRHLHVALIASLLVAAAGMFAPATSAYAASYSVSTVSTLITAINSANASSEDDTITLTADITLSAVDNTSVNGANGLPVIVSTATAGKLTIEGSGFTISRSSAGATPDFRIFEVASGADLTLDNVTISNGSAAHTFSGGGLQNNGTLNLLNSTITDNYSYDAGGPGIYNTSGSTMSVTNSTFSGNHMISGSYGGGGILNYGTLSVADSTFSNNVAASGGGISNGSVLTVTNSTFDNNSGFGSLENYGTLHITNSTISGQLGIASDFASATATLYNTIVDTTSSACLISFGAISADAHNIASDNTCDSATLKSSAQINLGSLANNGGATQTMALGAGSAAIDAGDATTCSASPVNNLDQRGVTRPVNVTGIAAATCDIGAYEANPTQLGPSFTVNSNADTDDGSCDALGSGIGNQDCTLREAINAANAHSGADTITFASGLSGATITLGSTLPAISDELTVDGSSLASPITISGNNSVEVLSVNSGKILTIHTLTIANGKASNGGGIYNGGTLTVTNTTFSNNSASNSGGGIDNSHGTMLTVTDSTFTGNSGGSGGAIDNNVAMNVSNSTFFNNNATGIGGGIDNGSGGDGATLTNTTFSGNTTASSLDGGGIGNFGALTLKNSIIANSGTGGDCHNGGAGSLTADSHNLADDNTCGSATQKTSVQINLQSLASNGGPTQTMALGAGSAAIDAGNDTVCIAAPVNNLDQRGVTRPQGSHCDVGAYELLTFPVTVNQAAGQSDPTNSSPIHFTVVFSQPIDTSTFIASDVTLGGTVSGTLSAVVTQIAPNDGTTFDIAVSGMTGSGTVTASIPANVVNTSAGNNNTASTSTDPTVTYDITPPTVIVNQAAGQSDPTNSSPIHFTAVFSKPINTSTFTASDVTLGGTASGTLSAIVTQIAPNDGTSFDIAVSGMIGSGTVTASIPGNAIQDLLGNNNTASTSTDHTVTYDITHPTVTVNQAVGQSDPANSSPIRFIAVFSKPINTSTFTASDVTLGGTAGGTTTVVTQIAPNNGTAFDIAVSGMTGPGTITASIPANSVKDPAGNPNTASTSTDNTVTFGHELLTNGGFNIYTGTSKVPQSWNAQNFSATDGQNTSKADVEEGSAAVQIGSHIPSLTKTLSQAIMLNGLQGDKFIFSFWVKGSAIPTTRSCMTQVLFYKNNPRTGPGTPYLLVGTQTVPCPMGTFAYAQETLNFLAPAAYNRIVVQFSYSAAAGMVWFDKASLLK